MIYIFLTYAKLFEFFFVTEKIDKIKLVMSNIKIKPNFGAGQSIFVLKLIVHRAKCYLTITKIVDLSNVMFETMSLPPIALLTDSWDLSKLRIGDEF